MKVIATIALLMSSSQALRVRDLGDLDLPEMVDENDVKIDKQVEAETKKFTQISQGDQELIYSFEK